MQVNLPMPVSELYDRLSILEVKLARITDEAKLINIRHELALLRREEAKIAWTRTCPATYLKITTLVEELRATNEKIWDAIDIVGRTAKVQGPEFNQAALNTFLLNIERCKRKREIDEALGSSILEEKQYYSA